MQRVRNLTKRQREILRLIACAKSNEEIADILNIKMGTIRSHRSAIARKLGMATMAEIDVLCYPSRRGLS
jgi:DNA-binding NarL/FixJ family response regulator